MKIVLVTGGFDPLHSGHISYLNEASKLGDKLAVGINSDEWLERKKGKAFLPYSERKILVEALSMVDYVIDFDDDDGTAIDAIDEVLKTTDDIVVFANGGDRNDTTTPEYIKYSKHPDVEFAFGVGGEDKKNSSSWILQEWKSPKTERNWGYYRVLHSDGPETKVKELTVLPGHKLSLQYHESRREYWMVSYGKASVLAGKQLDTLDHFELNVHDQLYIDFNEWHQLRNNTDKELRIIEIQYGKNCIEEDIIRINKDNS